MSRLLCWALIICWFNEIFTLNSHYLQSVHQRVRTDYTVRETWSFFVSFLIQPGAVIQCHPHSPVYCTATTIVRVYFTQNTNISILFISSFATPAVLCSPPQFPALLQKMWPWWAKRTSLVPSLSTGSRLLKPMEKSQVSLKFPGIYHQDLKKPSKQKPGNSPVVSKLREEICSRSSGVNFFYKITWDRQNP